ncbi:MAG: polyprenyl diphosphate synthase [Eubacteriales bacterium]|nr:polyprenyl diphosphate synthase [Eubacteriales bacterium]
MLENKQTAGADLTNLPRHIAIIMDGNGRWAKKRGLPRTAGHAAGAETFRRVATWCRDIGLEYLTVYAFSTENWHRPEAEVQTILGLLEKYLHEAIERMERDRVRMRFFGDTSVLSPKLQKLIAETDAISRRLDGCQVNVCVNYGGRDEILRAAALYAQSGEPMPPTEESFSRFLWSADVPDPDLLIRPGGEYRLSNFLLWQAAYAELYFTDTLWPDFDEQEMCRAIAAYQRRERRYGRIAT